MICMNKDLGMRNPVQCCAWGKSGPRLMLQIIVAHWVPLWQRKRSSLEMFLLKWALHSSLGQMDWNKHWNGSLLRFSFLDLSPRSDPAGDDARNWLWQQRYCVSLWMAARRCHHRPPPGATWAGGGKCRGRRPCFPNLLLDVVFGFPCARCDIWLIALLFLIFLIVTLE